VTPTDNHAFSSDASLGRFVRQQLDRFETVVDDAWSLWELLGISQSLSICADQHVDLRLSSVAAELARVADRLEVHLHCLEDVFQTLAEAATDLGASHRLQRSS
jgi:hypothetical protein